MACPHLETIAPTLQPPTPIQSVYREDCTQCFDSRDDPAGVDVCLQCFNGGCAGDRSHAQLHRRLWEHPLVLNIRRTRKVVVRDEPPLKMSKLAIAAETEEDRFDTTTTVKCLECNQELDKTSDKLANVVDGIMKANTFSRKEEVKAWEQELTSCEHILLMQQSEPRTIQSGDLGHCSACDLHENLWLCLECGNLGCGRKQMGGVDGNSHALAHSTESGHGVAVKLGSITPEGTADVYCYKCDEERIDGDLGQHLGHWGIILADRQKTEKSLTEMQIEQNLRWDFSMTTEDGKELKPLFGAGLTGLKNLGNSCYLASIVQCLFDTPAFKNRYFLPARDLPVVHDPAEDLETQLRKMADGLISGRYSRPDSDAVPSDQSPDLPTQKGLAPAMLKHLIGRGHAEFSTMRQQDAFELLQHIFKLITRSPHPPDLGDPTQPFRFVLEQRLQCLGCKKVRYSTNEQDNIFIDVPLEKLPAEEGAEAKPDAYKPVTLRECLDNFTAEEVVELTCSACGSKDGYTKRSLFKTLPENLVVNARKMAVINWVPVKIDVPVIVPDEPFLLDDYLSKGLQPSEKTLPDDVEESAPAFVANPEASSQLEAMGFGRNRCDRALHATGNSDANAAMEWLFAHMEDPDIDEPLVLSGGAGAKGDAADPEKIEMLGAMGFSVPQAKKALRETSGDVERAVEWLFSHPDDQGVFDDEEAPAAASDSAAPKPEAGSAATPAKYQLQSISCHKGTSIHAGHYVAFIRKEVDGHPAWVLFNDEKVVEAAEIEEMRKFAYVYFFKRV
ncbi:Ubiquitin carboxyl-terminal hydrolase 14 [Colletotrichum sp. SAR 10_70]|nr:Ubiquitin carboxyl-terminal hydrolase 14 [Colletotrichum sp. SAR 10_71]KAI8167062.1 Ubiquitin carboxyl-terminal hydrolase 14 [Colletotrichum sp. SAR 10_70]KAI8171416.1 Ubiquitin carboxyl-terminal hydrolase 14 [Colletotrichum sp. SAR 10_65]KAI8176761.1 Ubiquitin carboxyl-terminal hydrolase 14 [Colletotrichum sp. SAR 10_75]KAI8230432.1 Ubiquitin carboxyl-terminal hydrolase 14 [Colletotrichum sp. SAR 10_86]